MSEAAVLPFEPAAASGPDWLDERRAAAWERFRALGLPKPTDEEWRQTNPEAIARTAWRAAPPAAPALSVAADLPDGVVLGSLARLLADRPETVRAHLARIAPFERRAFAALNTAMFGDGAALLVPAGVELPAPVEIVHAAPAGAGPAASHPRTLLVLGERASATVVERYVPSGGGTVFTNSVTEIEAGPGSRLAHVRIVDRGAATHHVGTVWGRLGRDARTLSHSVVLGAPFVRVDLGLVLDGEGAEAVLDGLYLAGDGEHVDHHTSLVHARPHCPSRELYKGILWGSGRAVFNGRIVVKPDAQRTDAKQSNRNLLLSGSATVHTRPQLEIYADDVKCTHGATVGRLDPEQTFYLRARGIGEQEARRLLVRAFAAEVLDRIPVPGLGASLEGEIVGRLPL